MQKVEGLGAMLVHSHSRVPSIFSILAVVVRYVFFFMWSKYGAGTAMGLRDTKQDAILT